MDKQIKKEIAKVGMASTLTATVLSAPFTKRNKIVKNIHTIAGTAFCGFTLWHFYLYEPIRKSTGNKSPNILDKKTTKIISKEKD